jgi:hypothetical protein
MKSNMLPKLQIKLGKVLQKIFVITLKGIGTKGFLTKEEWGI